MRPMAWATRRPGAAASMKRGMSAPRQRSTNRPPRVPGAIPPQMPSPPFQIASGPPSRLGLVPIGSEENRRPPVRPAGNPQAQPPPSSRDPPWRSHRRLVIATAAMTPTMYASPYACTKTDRDGARCSTGWNQREHMPVRVSSEHLRWPRQRRSARARRQALQRCGCDRHGASTWRCALGCLAALTRARCGCPKRRRHPIHARQPARRPWSTTGAFAHSKPCRPGARSPTHRRVRWPGRGRAAGAC